MEVIATKRGEQKLCFEGCMYTKKNETTDKLIWRCVKRDDAVKCTAILQTSKNMDNPDMKKRLWIVVCCHGSSTIYVEFL
jgi:hypothetical protein